MDAAAVVSLLAQRHSDDLFLAEVKDGPTHGAEHLRLDAWAMRKSWAKFCTFGYEVKVQRSDWLRDEKVVKYADLVHVMNIVAPKGVVELSELPDGYGLLEVASTGTRLLTKRKPIPRVPSRMEDLLIYVLMFRSRPVARGYGNERTRDERVAAWKAQCEDLNWLKHHVSDGIRKMVDEARRKDERGSDALAQWEEWKKELERAGINPHVYGDYRKRQEINKLLGTDRIMKMAADADRMSSELAALAADLRKEQP